MIHSSAPDRGPLMLGRGSGRRRAPWRRRATRALAVLLIVAGALAVADGIVTLVWQEPISALYADIRQDDLSGALHRIEGAAPTAAEQRTLASLSGERHRVAFLASELERRAGDGSAVGRISIPRIGASFVIVKGTSTEDLESGPGILSQTRFPGHSGTTAIAGHRTTYLAPFRHIDALRPGNLISLRMPYGQFTYRVTGHRVVEPGDVQAAVASVGYARVVLSACTPLFSAAKRLLVYGRLTRVEPRGAALKLPGGAIAHPFGTRPASSKPLPAVLKPLDIGPLAPLV
jgi:sortase A